MIPARFAEESDEALVEGMDRGQGTLFPECLEDWICEDNPVRVIDVFVDEARAPSQPVRRSAAGTIAPSRPGP